jgi:tRNA-dihydrouridine synthase C
MKPMILALAPMEGVTDDVVREIVSGIGGVDYCVTEFLRVAGDGLSTRVLLRECPELTRGSRTPQGTPVHVQLLGGDPGRMGASAAAAAELGAPVIDINFGCPAPTVNRHDGGATLLKDPCRVEAVTAAVRRAVPPSVPVSAKIRLGWEDPDDVVSIAQAAEAGGASWLTIHGRTRAQKYAPPADWERIGRARAAIGIPVVANGDLNSPEDLARCREQTGCDRFMLGRGATARPEIFLVLRGLVPAFWPWRRRLAVLDHFVSVSLAREARGGVEGARREAGILSRVKQWCRSMATADPSIAALFETLKRFDRLEDAVALVRRESFATAT